MCTSNAWSVEVDVTSEAMLEGKVIAETNLNNSEVLANFVIPHGLCQYKVMPFGLKINPATFQQFLG